MSEYNVSTFQDYEKLAMALRKPEADERYALENLVGEVGELMGLRAKARRDGPREDYAVNYKKELGDILWQLTACVADAGLSLQEIAEGNLDKLYSRKARGVLRGSGDDR